MIEKECNHYWRIDVIGINSNGRLIAGATCVHCNKNKGMIEIDCHDQDSELSDRLDGLHSDYVALLNKVGVQSMEIHKMQSDLHEFEKQKVEPLKECVDNHARCITEIQNKNSGLNDRIKKLEYIIATHEQNELCDIGKQRDPLKEAIPCANESNTFCKPQWLPGESPMPQKCHHSWVQNDNPREERCLWCCVVKEKESAKCNHVFSMTDIMNRTTTCEICNFTKEF